MKKWLLIAVLGTYCSDYVISMERTAEKSSSLYMGGPVQEILAQIREEHKRSKCVTSDKILAAAKEGDTEAFEVLKLLVQDALIQGMGYKVAIAIREKEFASPHMAKTLSSYECVKDALDEINN